MFGFQIFINLLNRLKEIRENIQKNGLFNATSKDSKEEKDIKNGMLLDKKELDKKFGKIKEHTIRSIAEKETHLKMMEKDDDALLLIAMTSSGAVSLSGLYNITDDDRLEEAKTEAMKNKKEKDREDLAKEFPSQTPGRGIDV
jgi:hypothetical protein